MRGLALVLFCASVGLAAPNASVQAAGSTHAQGQPNWGKRDAAIYVVSTLNLLRTSNGQLLVQKLNATRFDVYDDLSKDYLYFVQLRSQDGSIVGTLSYEMGWVKPKSMSRSTSLPGIQRTPRSIRRSFRGDQRQLIGSFTSTMPH